MSGRTRFRPPEHVALLGLTAFTVVAVAGYWNFALHPDRLPATPFATRFFGVSFQFFAQVHIVAAASALLVALARRTGLRWTLPFAAVYGVSFVAEHLGTGYGVPFGGYGYTGLLGAKLGGRVPALIPLSWFLMAVPSWVLARAAARGTSRLARMAVGSAWMVTWDLALDPAMSHLTPYWLWEHTGPYYGMPWLNLLGWGVTAFVLMAVLDVLGPRAGLDRLSVRWAAAYYGVVLLMPLGMIASAGLWPATLATLCAVTALAALTRPLGDRRGTVRPRREQAGAVAPVGAP